MIIKFYRFELKTNLILTLVVQDKTRIKQNG